MPVFALTGNIACGKTSVLSIFREKGAIVFDCDRVIDNYYEKTDSRIYKEISVNFPDCIQGNRISKNSLGKKVFSDRKELAKLENIIHPVIVLDLLQWIKKVKNYKKPCVAEVPLLFEKNLKEYFDYIIVVSSSRDIILRRIIDKYRLAPEDAEARLSIFEPLELKRKEADFTIENNLDLESLKKEVDLLWKKMI